MESNLDPADHRQQQELDRLAAENKAQESELVRQAKKDAEQDLRLERIARMLDRVERIVWALIIAGIILTGLFLFFREYHVQINFQNRQETVGRKSK